MTSRHWKSSLLLMLVLDPAPALANLWPIRPELPGVVVSSASGAEYVRDAISDGRGGCIVLIESYRSGASGYYAQRIRSDGTAAWASNGVRLATIGQAIVAASDERGGAVFAWWDERNGINNTDITAQRVDSAGVVLWGAEGVSVCNLAIDVAGAPLIVGDGSGGAVVSWSDDRNSATTGTDVFAQRIAAAGTALWTANGVTVCNPSSSQTPSAVVRDSGGTFVFAWVDLRDNATSASDIYAQRLSSASGTRQWGTTGKVVVNTVGSQSAARLVADPSGGTFVAWTDPTTGTQDVRMQRLNVLGDRQWSTSGVSVISEASPRTLVGLVGSGGGAIAVTRDDRPTTGFDLYAQRMSADGLPLWSSTGALILATSDIEIFADAVSDGAGGVMVVMYTSGDPNGETLAQRLNVNGTREWTTSGLVVSSGASQSSSYIRGDRSTDGALWVARSPNNAQASAFLHRVDARGVLGDPRPAITRVSDVLADQGGRVLVQWSASTQDAEPSRTVASYSVWRQVPAALVEQRAARSARPLRVEGAGVAASFWEFVGGTPARVRSGYSMVVETTTDSMPGSNPLSSFLVSAETSSGLDFWDSAPATGYSVDNLAPAAPAPFAGYYDAGASRLAWNPNSEADLAGYRLYRGTSAGFAIGPATLVASLADTGYIDAAGAPYYYKLTAMDIHGNESPVAFLQPQGVLDAGVPGIPLRTQLSPPTPNPLRSGMRGALRYTLARAGEIRLTLHDAQGRMVRELISEPRSAGEHAVELDGRDAAGRRLAPGLYLARLEAHGQVATRRWVLMD